MPRFARVVPERSPHHITQRGNERPDVFFTATDREVYLGLLGHVKGILQETAAYRAHFGRANLENLFAELI